MPLHHDYNTTEQKKTEAQPAAASAAPQSNAFAPNTTPQPGLGRMGSIFSRLQSIKSITGNALTYLDEVTKTLDDRSIGADLPEGIQQRKLSIPGAMAFVNKNRAHIALFADATASTKLPASVAIQPAVLELKAQGIDTLNSTVISVEDYARPSNFGLNLASEFVCINDDLMFTLADASRESYEIDLNLANARNALDALSSHASKTRVDAGFVVSLKSGNEERAFQNPNAGVYQTQQILAVGVYVDFTQTTQVIFNNGMQQQIQKYVPFVHISDVQSLYRSPLMADLALIFATEVFIRNGGWVSAFSTFAKGQANIGNLITVDDGKGNKIPFHVSSIEQRQEFIQTYCMAPLLVIDVMEGRCRLPGLASLMSTDPNTISRRNETLSKFFGVPFQHNAPAATPLLWTVAGTIADRGERTDSRTVDYLNAIARGSNIPEVEYLRAFDRNAERRADVVTKIAGDDFKRLYTNHIGVLDWDLLLKLSQAAQGRLRIDGLNQLTGYGNVNLDLVMAQLSRQAQSQLSSIQASFGGNFMAPGAGLGSYLF